MMKIIFTLLVCCVFLPINAQTDVYSEDFNNRSFLSSWTLSTYVEHAYSLGDDNSQYLRFHPRYNNQFITSPNITLNQGNYILYFDWNKADIDTQDSIQVQMKYDNSNTWTTIYTIINGNNRNWQTDSVTLGNIVRPFQIRWRNFTKGTLPSQYFNMDNIRIEKQISTFILPKTTNVDFKIYPNPSDGNFQIKINNPNTLLGNIHVVNIEGKIIFTTSLPDAPQALLQINLSNLQNGNYILQIKTDEGMIADKLLILK